MNNIALIICIAGAVIFLLCYTLREEFSLREGLKELAKWSFILGLGFYLFSIR